MITSHTFVSSDCTKIWIPQFMTAVSVDYHDHNWFKKLPDDLMYDGYGLINLMNNAL